jgi:hypothetical protein
MSEDGLPDFSDFSFGPEPPLIPKVYPSFIKGTTCSASPTVLMVRLVWLDWALRGDSIWAKSPDDRNAETFKLERYLPIRAKVDAGAPIHMPWLYFQRGRTRIMDGRHRLYAFLDLGFTHCPVVVDPDYVAAISTLVDPDYPGSL